MRNVNIRPFFLRMTIGIVKPRFPASQLNFCRHLLQYLSNLFLYSLLQKFHIAIGARDRFVDIPFYKNADSLVDHEPIYDTRLTRRESIPVRSECINIFLVDDIRA